MFGVNSWEQVGQIVEGTFNEITNRENQLYNKRIRICRECPLYTNKPGIWPICDGKKWYNPETKESGIGYKPGTISGCGCMLGKKTRVKEAQCVLNKW